MKKKLFALFLLGCCASSSQAITQIGDYSFQENLNNAVTGTGALGNWSISHCTTSFENGYLTLNNRTGQYSGLYNVNASSAGSDWSLQLSVNLVKISVNYQQILKLGSDSSDSTGLMLVAGNGASDWGSGFGLTSAGSSGHNNGLMSTENVNVGEWNTISLISLNGTLQMYLNGKNITHTLTKNRGNGLTGLSHSLDALKLGYNNGAGNYGVADGTGFKDLKIWALNAETDTLSSVEAVMGVPEPATASLSLLGLASLMLRRRRA